MKVSTNHRDSPTFLVTLPSVAKGQINEQMNRVSFASSMAEKAGSGQKVQVLCEEDVRLVAGPVV